MPHLPPLPKLTVRAGRARAGEVPLNFVRGTSQAALRQVAIDGRQPEGQGACLGGYALLRQLGS